MNKRQWALFLKRVNPGYGFAVFRYRCFVEDQWRRLREVLESEPQ